MQILHHDSSILGDASASRTLTATVVSELTRRAPSAKLVYRDLVQQAIPHLDGAIAAGFRSLPKTPGLAAASSEHARSEELVAEFLASDFIVRGAPMYNFTVTSQLKAWIDRVVQPGKTFKYTPEGPVGPASGKRVIVVTTRGGIYTEGPLAALDFQEPYLKATLGFLGIRDVRFARAEGLSKGEAVSTGAMSEALEAALGAARTVIAS
ncbi:FMN-dependent NADH-azoreductase [Paracidovorax valerianellae]|uniref:FMN dependent NADH:quinone oxidoreductase n=1 Tax=Paracidovorax valerianellae TaxID=187868 RepID=A0A1G6M6Y4_9BURK|nr:NAD(P)H-dependent oxidoreductase [Paracidovorax valerianellae]MDA8446074.1 NAD(P)H-dependent oxidoreductase [Paracidovorax valerianellae]SDC51259.1 FMN-dependent NADH-azoreductase [Paracidovorax valerianellae]